MKARKHKKKELFSWERLRWGGNKQEWFSSLSRTHSALWKVSKPKSTAWHFLFSFHVSLVLLQNEGSWQHLLPVGPWIHAATWLTNTVLVPWWFLALVLMLQTCIKPHTWHYVHRSMKGSGPRWGSSGDCSRICLCDVTLGSRNPGCTHWWHQQGPIGRIQGRASSRVVVVVMVVAVVHVGMGVVVPHVHIMHVAVGWAHLRCQRIVPGLRHGRGRGWASLMQPVSWPGAGVCCCKGARGCSDLEVRMNSPQTGCRWGLVRAGPKRSWETTPLARESWAVSP